VLACAFDMYDFGIHVRSVTSAGEMQVRTCGKLPITI
jgi:hypothetical protein